MRIGIGKSLARFILEQVLAQKVWVKGYGI